MRKNFPQIDIDCVSAALEYVPMRINEAVHSGLLMFADKKSLENLNVLASAALDEVLKKHIGVDVTKYRTYVVYAKGGQSVSVRFSPHIENVVKAIIHAKNAEATKNYSYRY